MDDNRCRVDEAVATLTTTEDLTTTMEGGTIMMAVVDDSTTIPEMMTVEAIMEVEDMIDDKKKCLYLNN